MTAVAAADCDMYRCAAGGVRRPDRYLPPITTDANVSPAVQPHQLMPHRHQLPAAAAALPPIIQPQYLVTTHDDNHHNSRTGDLTHSPSVRPSVCHIAVVVDSEQTMGQWVSGSWVKWVNQCEWVTWVTGQYRKTLDP